MEDAVGGFNSSRLPEKRRNLGEIKHLCQRVQNNHHISLISTSCFFFLTTVITASVNSTTLSSNVYMIHVKSTWGVGGLFQPTNRSRLQQKPTFPSPRNVRLCSSSVLPFSGFLVYQKTIYILLRDGGGGVMILRCVSLFIIIWESSFQIFLYSFSLRQVISLLLKLNNLLQSPECSTITSIFF